MHHSAHRITEGQLLHGTGNAHITQTSFFLNLHRIIVDNGHITREQTILHTAQINIWKFQTFCTMQCHQNNFVVRIIHIVHICHKGNLFQQFIQGRLFRLLFIGDNLVAQFV